MPESVAGYRDLARIGHGGFSVVYRAHQDAFDRTVALKILRMTSDDEVQRRFLREVKLTGRLTGHPNVVTILDAGTTESGQPYLATELYEAGSLKERLREDGPLPAAEVAAIGAKIADALAAAHELGIVHRDVKPGNILVSRFGEYALADFGVGCLLDAAATGTVLDSFSPHHAAPEVMSRSSPSPASDVYSLGSTMYELLTGHPPFGGDGEEIAAVLWKIVHEPAPPARCPELPGLAEAIGRALLKEPQQRQASAAAFAQQLRALTRQEPSTAGPILAASAVAVAVAAAEPEAAGGEGQVPAEAMKVYVSAFEPAAAGVSASEQDDDDPEPAASRRTHWPLIAGAGFAVTVVTSLVVALLWSSPPAKRGTDAQSSPGGTSAPTGSVARAVLIGVASPSGSATSSAGLSGGGGTLPGASQSSAGTGATGIATSSTAGSAGSATSSAAAAPSTTPATTSTAAAPTGCTGWSYSDNSTSSATVKGNDKLRTGPYSSCTELAQLKNKTQVTLFCFVVNTNSETWVYAQDSAAGTAGWTTEAMFTGVTGTLNHC